MNMNVKVDKAFDTVCDAIRDVHDEASLWRLSDELVRVAPSGVEAVERVVAEAVARGIPTKSANTLRLYRDVAIRFPAADRVPLVSFSAHREAISIGDVKQARQILLDLAKQHGAAGVTVTTVKKAIGAATGVVSAPSSSGSASAKSTSWATVAVDLSTNGGAGFLAELDGMLGVSGVTLDGLHAGLKAVLADVESRRAKAARKAVAVKPSSGNAPARPARHAPKASSGEASPVAAGSGKRGDLRGL
jgi:hypothetical protein